MEHRQSKSSGMRCLISGCRVPDHSMALQSFKRCVDPDDALWSFRIPKNSDPAIQHHTPEDLHLWQRHFENLKCLSVR